jgi:hypothetical protein
MNPPANNQQTDARFLEKISAQETYKAAIRCSLEKALKAHNISKISKIITNPTNPQLLYNILMQKTDQQLFSWAVAQAADAGDFEIAEMLQLFIMFYSLDHYVISPRTISV